MEALGKLHMTVTRAYKVYLDDGQCKHVHVYDFIVTFLRCLAFKSCTACPV